MPRKRYTHELLKCFRVKPDQRDRRIEKDRKSGNNLRHKPKGQRKQKPSW